MRIEQDPHIINTENWQNLDGSPVVTTDYDEPVVVSLKRLIGILEGEESDLLAKIKALCEDPRFSEKQKQLIAAYLEDPRYRFRYRKIKADFIIPYEALSAELRKVRCKLADSRRTYARLSKGSDATE